MIDSTILFVMGESGPHRCEVGGRLAKAIEWPHLDAPLAASDGEREAAWSELKEKLRGRRSSLVVTSPLLLPAELEQLDRRALLTVWLKMKDDFRRPPLSSTLLMDGNMSADLLAATIRAVFRLPLGA